jgi:dTDP-4-dehydrorhamnose reductase
MAAMPKSIITGINGAVGSGLREALSQAGWSIQSWDRSAVSVADRAAMRRFLEDQHPQVVFHLATASQPTGLANESWIVNVEWPATLADLSCKLGFKLVFTSSVMVFTERAKGPFNPDSRPDAGPNDVDSYGYEKLTAEQRVLNANPHAVVARLGWQIGDAPGSNQMIDFLETQQAEHGKIEASRRWYPACSFIEDTARALVNLAQDGKGLFLLDSNRRWSFYEIVAALNEQRGGHWQVVPNDSFVYDQRMDDPMAAMPSLAERLPGLIQQSNV